MKEAAFSPVFCYSSSADQNRKENAVADNILKKQLDCISEDFLRGVYAEATKPMRGALRHLFGKVTTGKSTLVRDIARSLRADSSRAEAKRAEEKVSGWLGRWDFSKPVNPWLLKRAEASDDETYAVDFSDISKEFGGEGMEGMAMGWDGSRGVTAMGHDFICVSLVGARWREARPVYAKLAKGRKSKGELHGEALDAVMEATGGRGWTAEDRGMDSAEHLHGMKSKGRKGVVRVNDMKRDVFGDGLSIGESLASVPFRKAHLHTHRGDRRVEIRWKRGTVQYCENPKKKDAPVENVGVLVVESRFDGKSIWLYAVCPDEMFATEEGALRVAVRAAQAYCDRWQIETSFQTVKQEFALEKARVRTFRRLENIFSLCILAYVFATDFLRRAKGFKKVLKHLSDNLEAVSMRTRALLAGIRALVNVEKIRFISGRPRKPFAESPLQMVMDL